MDQITIECKNITKTFGTQETENIPLRNINLVAHENELIMLMGPSGSGKTTLISIIGGILQQTSGECTVLNQPINSLPTEEKTKFRGKNIGFMFQYLNLIPTLNALENAAIPLMLNGYNRSQAMDETKKMLIDVDLEKRIYQIPSDLSGGEQQRVCIVRACIHRPKIILCDEPTSFLDHERGKKIMQLLQKIKVENKCTLIVVTHDPRILEFADRIIEIEDGMIKNSSNNKTNSNKTNPDI
jgi:putative ABC transport system ATP-binding protein